MTVGNPVRLIIQFMIPMFLGNVFQQFYNIVDSIVAGQFIGVDALAAIGSTGSLMFFVTGWLNGLSSGFAIIVAQRFGAKKYEDMRHFVAMSIYLMMGFAVAMTIGFLVFNIPILRLMNSPAELMDDVAGYMGIIYAGLLVTAAYNTLAAFLRALGDSKSPLYFLVISAGINVVLDVVLIRFAGMGVEGCAYATVIAQAVSAICCLIYIIKRYPILHLKKENFRLQQGDYSALFQNNNDTMFDSVKFGVAIVTDKDFEALNQVKLQYNYAWVYDKKPETEKKEKKMAEDLMEDMTGVVTLESFVPQFQNQSICFTGDDMGSDRAMMVMLLYIVMAILAFVFGITISNTIRKEAGVIGTLRASGYTRRELIIHYMSLPVVITLIGALVGNILGYTLLKQVCAGMYYGSYSLPTYVTIWNAEAFWMTTVVPVIIMLTINYGILYYKLRLSPLKFIRRDLSSRKQKRAVYLSTKLGIFRRFRLRVIFQNISNYLVLFVGIIFANLLL